MKNLSAGSSFTMRKSGKTKNINMKSDNYFFIHNHKLNQGGRVMKKTAIFVLGMIVATFFSMQNLYACGAGKAQGGSMTMGGGGSQHQTMDSGHSGHDGPQDNMSVPSSSGMSSHSGQHSGEGAPVTEDPSISGSMMTDGGGSQHQNTNPGHSEHEEQVGSVSAHTSPDMKSHAGQHSGGQDHRDPVTEDQAMSLVEDYLESTQNPNLMLGEIAENDDYFEAEITTRNGDLVDRIRVDKYTGRLQSAYSL